jgi:isoquinoline 1-oxidoreductase beta subunit
MGDSFTLNPYVRIDTDGIVTIVVNKSEMGQGVSTSLPMLVAEELECAWEQVRVEAAPVGPDYSHTLFGIQATGGSTSILSEWERMRRVGAQAREKLIAAAADTRKAERTQCRAEKGAVVHAGGARLTYGELAQKASAMPPSPDVPLKDPADFSIIGRPTRRLDAAEKVNGRAIFGIDMSVPGMLTAMVVRPPVFGGRLTGFDAAKAKAVPGVREVVAVPSGVAVVADTFWSATLGRRALAATWDEGPLSGLTTQAMREQYAALARAPGAVARSEGDVEAAFARAATRIEAEYEVPFLAQAPMEPLNCLIDLREDGCDIWTGTQFPGPDRDAAARALGMKREDVRVHTLLLGGGFGRRANPQSDFVLLGCEVARAVRKPVKVVWTREDDMKGGYYRPMLYDWIAAGLDAGGNLTAWRHTVVGQSILKGTPFEGLVQGEIEPCHSKGRRISPTISLTYSLTFIPPSCPCRSSGGARWATLTRPS